MRDRDKILEDDLVTIGEVCYKREQAVALLAAKKLVDGYRIDGRCLPIMNPIATEDIEDIGGRVDEHGIAHFE